MNRAALRNFTIRGARRKGKAYVHAPMPKEFIQAGLNKIFIPPKKEKGLLGTAKDLLTFSGTETTTKKKKK